MPSRRSSTNEGLSDDEIALIKAMHARGKEAGFTSQKILSYFSRPERTVNVARIYEIRDGLRGPEIPPASDVSLDWFLFRFDQRNKIKESNRSALPSKPAPAYIDLIDNKIALVSRTIAGPDDHRVSLREKLLASQHRLAISLAEAWDQLNVDRRIKKHVYAYANLAAKNHSTLNIFDLDTEFLIISRSINNDPGGLGEIGEAQWDKLRQQHMVITDLYPEMRAYRAELTKLSPDAELAEEEARQAIAILIGPEGQKNVAPEVPELVNSHIAENTQGDEGASRKRTYDVAAMLNAIGSRLVTLIELLPKIEKASETATALWDRYWPLLKIVLTKVGWI